MRRLTNMGIPTSKAKMIIDLSCKEANQFSHYKIGGKILQRKQVSKTINPHTPKHVSKRLDYY